MLALHVQSVIQDTIEMRVQVHAIPVLSSTLIARHALMLPLAPYAQQDIQHQLALPAPLDITLPLQVL
jgi:hypothetical protein